VVHITDAEAAEVAWASSDEGKAAVRAAWERAGDLGIAGPHEGMADVHMSDIGAIAYAAHLAAEAAGEDPEEEEAPPDACPHQWAVLKAQDCTPWVAFGKPTPHTAVLARCLECAQPEAFLLIGAWTAEDLEAMAPAWPAD